jgi:hypothetical protein
MKSTLKSIIVTQPKEVNLKNITTLTVANYGTVATKFKLNGIERNLPAINSEYNLPIAPFVVANSNFPFDVDFYFENNNTNIVVDYLQLPEPQKQC